MRIELSCYHNSLFSQTNKSCTYKLNPRYLEPLGITGNKLALALHVTPPRIIEIVSGKRGITTDTALRLAKCLSTSAEYWLTLQMKYDIAAVQKNLGERLEQEIRPISLEPPDDKD